MSESRIGADYTDDADYRIGDGGRWLGVGNRSSVLQKSRESEFPPTEDSIRGRESGFNGEPAERAYYFVPISEILRYKE